MVDGSNNNMQQLQSIFASLEFDTMKKKAAMSAEAPMETKMETKKPKHPAFSAMIADAFMELNQKEEHPHGHGIGAIKHVIATKHPDMHEGWEHHLSKAMKLMENKKQLVHVAGHHGMFKLSKAMLAKQERKMALAKKKAEKAEKGAQKPPVKAKSPAKRAAKAGKKAKA